MNTVKRSDKFLALGFSTFMLTDFVSGLSRTLKQKGLNPTSVIYNLSTDDISLILDHKNQRQLITAIDRYIDSSLFVGFWFFSENIQSFMGIYRIALREWEYINQLLAMGTSQALISHWFNVDVKSIRFISDRTIPKKNNRSNLSVSAQMMIDTVLWKNVKLKEQMSHVEFFYYLDILIKCATINSHIDSSVCNISLIHKYLIDEGFILGVRKERDRFNQPCSEMVDLTVL